jgi:hypothetical protein
MKLLVGTAAGAFTLGIAEPVIPDTRINHIARAGEGWWAVGDDGALFHDGQQMASVDDQVTLNCVLPVNGDIWVGASEARLFRLEDGDLIEDPGFAAAPERARWYTPWGGPPDVRSMAADHDGTIFINVHVGGILRYDREGLSPTLDQDADVHQVVAGQDLSGRVLAACARGLAHSTDGMVFEFRTEGLHASYCRAVALLGETILLSASTGPRSNRARLYRGDLVGGSFEPCTQGLPEWFDENLDSHCLAVVDDVGYAGQGDTVWRSEDQGVSWAEARSGLPRITCLA